MLCSEMSFSTLVVAHSRVSGLVNSGPEMPKIWQTVAHWSRDYQPISAMALGSSKP